MQINVTVIGSNAFQTQNREGKNNFEYYLLGIKLRTRY